MPSMNRPMTREECLVHSEKIKRAYREKTGYYERICELNRNRIHKKGIDFSEVTRRKMSESAKRRDPFPEEMRKKMSASARRRSTPEYRNHIRDVLKRRVLEGHGEKVREAHKKSLKVKAYLEGLKDPEYRKKLGTKISVSLSSSQRFKEFQKRMQNKWSDPIYRERRILEYFFKRSDIWYGSVTDPSKKWQERHKYCYKFDDSLKDRVRAFFNYRCVECGTPQDGKGLDVHYVNEKKDACCNEKVKRLFVALCPYCHGRTRRNPPYWEDHFTTMINEYYGGKCYFTKEEYWQFAMP
jgi:hypothetical protein